MDKTQILVVDDDPAILRFLGANLKARDYQVIMAADGEEALGVIDREHVDLVVLDLMMPRMDGVTLFRKARAQCPGIPFLAMSGDRDEREMLAEGFEGFVRKPCGIRRLVEAVAQALDRMEEKRPPERHLLEAETTTRQHVKVIGFPGGTQGKHERGCV